MDTAAAPPTSCAPWVRPPIQALDLNPAAIAFCRTRHVLPGVDFVYRQRRKAALSRPVLRRRDQHRILGCLSSLFALPRRSCPRAAPQPAIFFMPISAHTTASPNGTRRWPRPRCGCFRAGTSTRRFCAVCWKNEPRILDLINRTPRVPARYQPRIQRPGRFRVLPCDATRKVFVPNLLLHPRLGCEVEFILLRPDLERAIVSESSTPKPG